MRRRADVDFSKSDNGKNELLKGTSLYNMCKHFYIYIY